MFDGPTRLRVSGGPDCPQERHCQRGDYRHWGIDSKARQDGSRQNDRKERYGISEHKSGPGILALLVIITNETCPTLRRCEVFIEKTAGLVRLACISGTNSNDIATVQ